MAKSKRMNENAFSKILKELGASGELILSRQKEKQAVMDSFESERKRYRGGKISEATLRSSIKKTSNELARLDKSIREAIKKVGKIAANSREFATKQSPKRFKVSLSGISGTTHSKKPSKKKVTRIPSKVKKAELKLDRKYQRR